MPFNISKCNFSTMTRKRSKILFNYKLNGKVLQEETAILYLGMILDSTLNWKSQINKCTSKALQQLGMLQTQSQNTITRD